MSWVLLLIYSAIIFYLVYKLKFFHLEGLGKWTPSLFFLLKIISGIALWAVYTIIYTDRSTADIWKYFDDSKIMYDALYSHPGDFFRMLSGIGDTTPHIEFDYYHKMLHWYRLFDNNLLNDAHIVIRFNALIRIISMGNYFTHSLFMCFLSFTGLCAIYKIIFPALKEWKTATAGIIFLLPSLLFWSSGVLKEGLMIFGFGLLVYQVFKIFTDKKWWRIILIIIGGSILTFSKFYVIVGVIPPLVAAIIVMKYRKNVFLKFSIVFLLFFAASYSLKWIAPEREPLRLLANKQNEFLKMARGGVYLVNDSIISYISPEGHTALLKVNDTAYQIKKGSDYYYWINPAFDDTIFVKKSNDTTKYKLITDFPKAGSLIEGDYLQPTLKSFIIETPRALFHALFRPFIWEGKNPMSLIPALENLLLLILLIFALFFRRKISNPEIFGFCLLFSFILLLVIGLTTPVVGALVRYRIVAFPFLLLSILMMIDREKVLKKFSWLSRIGI